MPPKDVPPDTPPTSPTDPPADPETLQEQAVPYARFREVIEQKNALQAQLEQAPDPARLLELEQQLEAQRVAHAEDLSMFEAGLDDAGRSVARHLWSQLPDDARPESVADWVRSLRDQPDGAPKPLQPYLAPPAPPAAPTQPAPSAAPPAAAPPDPDANRGPQPTPPTEVTDDMIRAAEEKARRTGDWTPVRELLDRLRDELRR